MAKQSQINRNLTMRYTPRLSFELDLSMEKAAHMLDILGDMERESGTDESDEPGRSEEGPGPAERDEA